MSVSSIQAREKKKKARIGSDGTHRGRLAASIDSAGGALGCSGPLAFALTCWKGLPNHNAIVRIAISLRKGREPLPGFVVDAPACWDI